ncbi:MAG TPA: hypothetical protein PKU71_05530 [bacterium]|nr:hypothetical protein [bacterium]HMW35899.1 hypothetical protein [bacterium]HMY36232.1 hypothetical protein [bacterium]HMZ03538.1 hypothetical protein [bacterium]HNB08085.1 hypothetical protein [bacterium]
MHNKPNPSTVKSQIHIHPSGHVYLATETRKRFIGKIITREFHCERDPERHILRVNNSIGFNLELMRMSEQFDWVIITGLSSQPIIVTRDFILRKGFLPSFKNQSYELQIFVKLNDLKKADTEPDLFSPEAA